MIPYILVLLNKQWLAVECCRTTESTLCEAEKQQTLVWPCMVRMLLVSMPVSQVPLSCRVRCDGACNHLAPLQAAGHVACCSGLFAMVQAFTTRGDALTLPVSVWTQFGESSHIVIEGIPQSMFMVSAMACPESCDECCLCTSNCMCITLCFLQAWTNLDLLFTEDEGSNCECMVRGSASIATGTGRTDLCP